MSARPDQLQSAAYEEPFRLLVESVKEYAIFMLDPHGFIQTWNMGAERIKGYQASEIIGKNFSQFYTEEDLLLGKPQHELEVAIRDGHYEEEGWRLRKDGSRFWANVVITALWDKSGELRGFAKVTRDLTGKRAAEAAMAREQALTDFIENAPVGLHWVGPDGTIIWVNQTELDLLGYTQEEYVGHHISEFHADEATIEDILQRLKRNETLHGYEADLRRKDGSIRHVLISSNVLWQNGEFVHTRCFTRDITERKEAELARERYARDLARSNSELQQFAYVASHDLKEPLRMIANYAQLLEHRYKDKLDETAREFIQYVVTGARRLNALIEDLLSYSRLGEEEHSAKKSEAVFCSGEQALKQTLLNLQASVQESNATITHDVLPQVMMDEMRLIQLFQNLLGNAIKFRRADAPRIHIGVRRTAEFWEFSVSDNGIGIESQYLNRIFSIFQRLHTRDQYAGNGIGLAICKKIVEQYGGQIWATSQPNVGTTFFFTVPALTGGHHV